MMPSPLSIPWEAWATIVSGLAAVLAALAVGLVQQGIARQLAQLEAMKFREILFDRRFEFVTGITEFIGRMQTDKTINEREFAPFKLSVRRAEYLFSDQITKALGDILDQTQILLDASDQRRDQESAKLNVLHARFKGLAKAEMRLEG